MYVVYLLFSKISRHPYTVAAEIEQVLVMRMQCPHRQSLTFQTSASPKASQGSIVQAARSDCSGVPESPRRGQPCCSKVVITGADPLSFARRTSSSRRARSACLMAQHHRPAAAPAAVHQRARRRRKCAALLPAARPSSMHRQGWGADCGPASAAAPAANP